MIAPRFSSLLAALLLTIEPSTLVFAGDAHTAPSADPNTQLEQLMSGLVGADARVDRLAKIIWIEPHSETLKHAAREAFAVECGTAGDVLLKYFESGDDARKLDLLHYVDRDWDQLTSGTNTVWIATVSEALRARSPALRQRAAQLTTRHSLFEIANALIDAAIADPSLTLNALRGIRISGDLTGSRWTISQLVNPDPKVRIAAQQTLARLGPTPGREILRVQLTEGDAITRRAALEGLLILATNDDLPLLAAWLEKPDPKELVPRVTKAVAALQAGFYRPELPADPY